MPQFAIELLVKLEDELNSVPTSNPGKVRQTEKSLLVVRKYLTMLKKYLRENKFSSAESEIRYFKEIQPGILSKVFYFKELLSIEQDKPKKCLPKNIRCFYQKSLKRYKKYFKDNSYLYEYYKNNSSHLDDKYFIRSDAFTSLPDDCIFLSDSNCTTGYDIIMARFIAYELICDYIILEISNIDHPGQNPKLVSPWDFKWTDSKISLTELLYAIHSAKSINNGKVKLKDLVSAFEMFFGVELNEACRTYQDLKNRSERTKYLDSIKSALINKLDKGLD
jgi:hypothetical protein